MCIVTNPENDKELELVEEVKEDVKDLKINSLVLLNHAANSLCEDLIKKAEEREAYIREMEMELAEFKSHRLH